jgi:hypothetical protein
MIEVIGAMRQRPIHCVFLPLNFGHDIDLTVINA